jgi:hypothetical protein
MFLAAVAVVVLGQVPAQAQPVLVYDSLHAAVEAGYGEVDTNNPIFGDAITLAQAGMLNQFGFSIYNSNSSTTNPGPILTGTETINIYDNTVPYTGGSLATKDPLIGSATLTLSFGTGLPVGGFSRVTSDFSSLNLTLPQNIFVTQQFAETSGTSTENGVVLFGNSAVGSSPNSVYINSAGTPEGLYSFGGGAANSQFGYSVQVTPVPEPSSVILCGLAAAGWWRRRRAG